MRYYDPIDKPIKCFLVMWLIAAVISLITLGAVIFTAIHFIAKLW